jgi:hypothetical protein
MRTPFVIPGYFQDKVKADYCTFYFSEKKVYSFSACEITHSCCFLHALKNEFFIGEK